MEERKGAEIDYLKRFGPAWVKCGGSQDSDKSKPTADFIKIHPRFEHLVSGEYFPSQKDTYIILTPLNPTVI